MRKPSTSALVTIGEVIDQQTDSERLLNERAILRVTIADIASQLQRRKPHIDKLARDVNRRKKAQEHDAGAKQPGPRGGASNAQRTRGMENKLLELRSWYARATKAKAKKEERLCKVNTVLLQRRKQERHERRTNFERCFMQVAVDTLDKETFLKINDKAAKMAES